MADIVIQIKTIQMKLITLLFFSIYSIIIYGQNDGIYTSKYWNYKYALRGDDKDTGLSQWEPK